MSEESRDHDWTESGASSSVPPTSARREEDSDLLDLDALDDRPTTSPIEAEGEAAMLNTTDELGGQADAAGGAPATSAPPRRSIVKAMLAVALGAVALVTPVAAGVWMWLSPLLRRGDGGGFIEVGRFSSLPEDGSPVRRPVIARRTDAWSTYPATPIGAVYLRRTGPDQVLALSAVCPHAGCFVSLGQEVAYACPCHASEFDRDGDVIAVTSDGKQSVSPRGLDSLESRVEDDRVLVRYQSFVSGRSEKIAKS